MSETCILSMTTETAVYTVVQPDATNNEHFVLHRDNGSDDGQVKVLEFHDSEMLVEFLEAWIQNLKDWGYRMHFITPWLARELDS